MSARFLVLFPSDIAEVAMAFHVIDSLRRTHQDAWIGCLIQKDVQWLSEGFKGHDATINFEKTPGEKKREILDLIPDYLIDLSGKGKFWLFKNRLRLMDFSFSVKSLKLLQTFNNLEEKLQQYEKEIQSLLSAFELLPFKRMVYDKNSDTIVRQFIPKSFLKGFVSMNLNDFDVINPESINLSEYLNALDYPTVIIGEHNQRDLGDKLAREVGCTLFNTCGDLSSDEMRSVYSGGKVFISRGETRKNWAFITHKRYIDLNVENDPQSLRKQLRAM